MRFTRNVINDQWWLQGEEKKLVGWQAVMKVFTVHRSPPAVTELHILHCWRPSAAREKDFTSLQAHHLYSPPVLLPDGCCESWSVSSSAHLASSSYELVTAGSKDTINTDIQWGPLFLVTYITNGYSIWRVRMNIDIVETTRHWPLSLVLILAWRRCLAFWDILQSSLHLWNPLERSSTVSETLQLKHKHILKTVTKRVIELH